MRGVRHINAILKRAQRSFTHGYATDSRAVSAAGEFWSSVQVQDLPESSPELEIARRHNSSLPYRPELIVQGSIVHVDRDHVTVDTGHPARTSFAKKELHVRQLVRSRDTGIRTNAQDFRIGDVLHFVLEELITPFGDIGLRVYRPSDKDRLKLIWEELSAAHAHERTVKGRLLNAMFSGYAVGIAGIVAYLPGAQAGKLAPRNIGALQEFYITELKPETRTVVLADPGVWANRHKLKRDTRMGRGSQKPINWNLRSKDTLVRPQILALIASARAMGGNSTVDPETPSSLQAALDTSERGEDVSREQAFKMLQDLKAEARPEVFRAVWGKLRTWNFDVKGLVLDGVPVVDTRQMVELRTAKPAQTVNWRVAPAAAKARRRDTGGPGASKEADATPLEAGKSSHKEPEPKATAPDDKPRVYTANLDEEFWDR